MPDELGPDDLNQLWQSHGEPGGASADEMRRRARLYQVKRRQARRGIAALMLLSAVGYVAFLFVFAQVTQRVGAGLTIAGYLYALWRLFKRSPLSRTPQDAAAPTVAVYRSELERQRDFLRNACSDFVLPFIPGPAVFAAGFLAPEFGLAKAAALCSILALTPFVVLARLMRRKAAAWEREIRELGS